MNVSFAARHAPSLFFGLFSFVVALSMIAPRAASFAATLAGIVALIWWRAGKKEWLRPRAAEWFFAITIPALAAISALWAIDPGFAVERGIKLAVIIIPALFFIAAARTVHIEDVPGCFIKGLLAVFIAISAFIGLDIFLDLVFYRAVTGKSPDEYISIVIYNRSIVVMTVFFPLLMLILYRAQIAKKIKIVLGGAALVSMIPALIQTESQSAQLFFILSLLFAALFPVKHRTAWVALGAVVIAAAIAAPWIAQFLFAVAPIEPATLQSSLSRAASVLPRLQLWDFIAGESLKYPLHGQGIEAARFLESEQWMPLLMANNMLHPHNAVLQLWVEFGVIGIALGSAFFTYILTRLWRAPVIERKITLSVLMGMLVIMSSGYGLWQSWQIGLILALFSAGALCLAPAKDINLEKTKGV